MIAAVRASTDRPFNVNVFCHHPAVADPARETAWLARLAPDFRRYGVEPPAKLTEIYRSFVEDDAMLTVFLEERPRVVSFHFGMPSAERIKALRNAGIMLFATATNLAEARAIAAAGVDAVVAQGFEAGGHRGVFDPEAHDDRLGYDRSDATACTKTGYPCDRRRRHHGRSRNCRLSPPRCLRRPARHGFRRVPGVLGGRGLPKRTPGWPRRTHGNDEGDFGPARPLPRQPIYSTSETRQPTRWSPTIQSLMTPPNRSILLQKPPGKLDLRRQWAGQGAPMARSLPAATLVAQLQSEMEQAFSRREG